MWINPAIGDKLIDFQPNSVVFDMDGVLIDNAHILEFDIVTLRFIFTQVYGLRDSGMELLTRAEIAAFKQAGGFNDDFDLIYGVVALYNAARLEQGIGDTASLRHALPDLIPIARAQQDGLPGLLAGVPPAARPDWTMVQEVCGEIYWGADTVRQKLGREPHYVDRVGMCEQEQAFAKAPLMDALTALGLTNWGIITGRIAIEMDMALRHLPANMQQPMAQVTGDVLRKPDPTALVRLARTIASSGGYYVGDTADDLRLVQNYMALRAGDRSFSNAAPIERTIGIAIRPLAEDKVSGDDLPPFLSIMVAPPAEEALWQERDADAIIGNVNELPELLRKMRSVSRRNGQPADKAEL